jgi:hypothetical protein
VQTAVGATLVTSTNTNELTSVWSGEVGRGSLKIELVVVFMAALRDS